MSASKKIKVCVRFRPSASFAQDNIRIAKNGVTIQARKDEGGHGDSSGVCNNAQDSWNFKFHAVLQNASQETVFDTIAREVVMSGKAKERLHTNKAQLHSLEMQIQQQASMLKVQGAMAMGAQAMGLMNQMMSVPQMNATMRAMSKEMFKAGMIEEMMDDAMDSVEDPDTDEMADAELEAVMRDIVPGLFGDVKLPTGGPQTVPAAPVAAPVPAPAEPEVDDMERRLAALQAL